MATNEKREPSTIGWKIVGELNSEMMQSLPPFAALWLASRITEAVNAARAPARQEGGSRGDGLGDGKRICEALGFDPINHHNALKCPYCNPNGWVLAPTPAANSGGECVDDLPPSP